MKREQKLEGRGGGAEVEMERRPEAARGQVQTGDKLLDLSWCGI